MNMSQKDLLSNARRVPKGTDNGKNNIGGGTRKSLKFLRIMFLTTIPSFAPTKGQTLALVFQAFHGGKLTNARLIVAFNKVSIRKLAKFAQ